LNINSYHLVHQPLPHNPHRSESLTVAEILYICHLVRLDICSVILVVVRG